MLLHEAFKDIEKDQDDDQIDVDTLLMFGLLHCHDNRVPQNKAICFYELLQDGGFTKHEHISWRDKDLPPVFSKLCALVTTELFDFSSVKNKVSRSACQSLSDTFEVILEDFWLEAVFESQGKLHHEVWLEKVKSKAGNFIFDAALLRSMIFEQAGVEV